MLVSENNNEFSGSLEAGRFLRRRVSHCLVKFNKKSVEHGNTKPLL
jgi:hypothetical protein